MQILIPLLVGFLVLFGSTSDAAYLVRLKNGRQFIASHYWREGKRIIFEIQGGTLAIEKEFISKIEPTERPVRTEPEAPKREEPQPEKRKETASKPAEASKEAPKKNEEVLKEFRLLQQRFSRLNDLPIHEIYKLSDDLAAFRRKLLDQDLVETHKEEFDGANSLIRAIETLLKVRGR
ncbi:MAG: hypothetical protein HY695_16910 [Deltaproteobacteria bacterium]|nr:hypothetical protein [Deltaproteobacteria bacterium]